MPEPVVGPVDGVPGAKDPGNVHDSLMTAVSACSEANPYTSKVLPVCRGAIRTPVIPDGRGWWGVLDVGSVRVRRGGVVHRHRDGCRRDGPGWIPGAAGLFYNVKMTDIKGKSPGKTCRRPPGNTPFFYIVKLSRKVENILSISGKKKYICTPNDKIELLEIYEPILPLPFMGIGVCPASVLFFRAPWVCGNGGGFRP